MSLIDRILAKIDAAKSRDRDPTNDGTGGSEGTVPGAVIYGGPRG